MLLIDYCKSNSRSHCVLAQVQLWNISLHPPQTFVQLEQCASLHGSRWILSRRQHASNNQCALNNDVRLINRFYGIIIVHLYWSLLPQYF